jgi:hypothetical protein
VRCAWHAVMQAAEAVIFPLHIVNTPAVRGVFIPLGRDLFAVNVSNLLNAD